jgi:ribosomal protein S27E
MKRYENDPRVIVAKFESSCKKCGKKIKKGTELYYWPSSREINCLACGETDYNQFLSSAQDEEFYASQYGSY